MIEIPATTQIEGEMIARDGWTLRRVVEGTQRERGRGILSLALLPFVSFYLVETHDWLQRNSATPFAGQLGAYDAGLRDMRARLKIFDTNRGGLREVTRRLKAVEEQSVAAFNHHHRGILGLLKRALQDDLGLFFLGADLVCTTHVGAFSPSLVPEPWITRATPVDPESSPYFAFGAHCGRILDAITQAAGERFSRTWQRSSIVDTEFIWYEDHKAAQFYTRLNQKLHGGDGLAAPITFMVSQVNFVHRWMRHMLPPDSAIATRFRFLVCFHALRGLKTLAAATQTRGGALYAMAARIVSSASAKKLRRMERLRAVVAHYDLSPAAPDQLTAADPFRAVVEALSKHMLYELEALVDETLNAMSMEFRQLIRVTKSARVLEAPASAVTVPSAGA